jgi:NADH:ubiquinone oxidoreductase subunit 6 (subunit J)
MLLIIYVGAIAVLFLFVVMTTEVDKKQVPRDLFLSVSNPNPSK